MSGFFNWPRLRYLDQKFETFEGELFNQNENAFYLFEPLAAIQSEMSTMGCDKMIEQKIKYVKFIIWTISYSLYYGRFNDFLDFMGRQPLPVTDHMVSIKDGT